LIISFVGRALPSPVVYFPLSFPDLFGLIPATLQNFRRIAELLSRRRTQITLADATFDPETWCFYLATLCLLASISELAMVIPYHPGVAQHYETIIAHAEGTLCTFSIPPLFFAN
jgi:hypothetical protein